MRSGSSSTVPSWTLTGGRGSPHVRDFRRRAGMNVDDAVIEELTLLLLDLTSWTEDGLGTSVRRAWKGSLFETLDALEAKGFLTQGRREVGLRDRRGHHAGRGAQMEGPP